jgi:hypothetical protein
MAEITQIYFDYNEIVELLVRKQGIQEGIWALSIEFGIAAANLGGIKAGDDISNPPSQVTPTALIPIQRIGIVKTDQLSNISVDAAKVNPKPKSAGQKKKA